MSEIKLTKDSIENAILKDSKLVGGYVNDNGYISAKGNGAVAIGYASNGGTIEASGNGAHAEGYNTRAWADGAHAGGIGTIANKNGMTAIGKYNNTNAGNLSGDYLFVVGNGTSTSSRSNAFAVTTNGITATSLSVTNATISTATISTLNGSSVPNNPKFTDTVYEHPGVTPTITTSSVSPSHNGTFSVIADISIDSSGHVTKIDTKTVKLPDGGSIDTDTKQKI